MHQNGPISVKSGAAKGPLVTYALPCFTIIINQCNMSPQNHLPSNCNTGVLAGNIQNHTNMNST